MKKKSIGVFGVGKDDEMASARGRVGRVWIGGGELGPAKSIGIKEPETVLCERIIVRVDAAMDDELWRRAWAGGGCVGVSWGGDKERICGRVLEGKGWVAGIGLRWW